MDENATENTIDVLPTKDFFISTLVRDIELADAIADLVDNSVDGARRVRPDGGYAGLWIRLEVYQDRFRIVDNCGGIPLALARNYAFRIGRPAGVIVESTKHSVGQFGVGMKRALFKLGRRFTVQSTTPRDHFSIEVDVDEWRSRERDWTFAFQDKGLNDSDIPLDECGTDVTVASLYEAVATQFARDNFKSNLRQELQSAHRSSIEDGLTITLNGVPLRTHPLQLIRTPHIQPSYWRGYLYGRNIPVDVRLCAGIRTSQPKDAGWNVFCNGRLLLESDTTIRTGWGESDATVVPRYHNQFARFAGYAFFDADDASVLPWNTTKTGVDVDSLLYASARQQMIRLMRPVINFLNALDRDNDLPEEDRRLEPLVRDGERTGLVDISQIEDQREFSWNVPDPPQPVESITRVAYTKPTMEFDKVRTALGVRTAKAVGEKTFDYFRRREVVD